MLNEKEAALYELAKDPGQNDRIMDLIGPEAVNLCDRDERGRTLLHIAAEHDNPDLCRFLVERCSLSALEGDREGVTPYDLASARVKAYFADVYGLKGKRLVHNPVLRGFNPDPCVVKVGKDYYLANSSFVFFPAIPISHSRDLVHWHTIGHAVVDGGLSLLDGMEGGRGYWAADISYDGTWFYIAATLRGNEGAALPRRQMVCRSKRPEGPYSAPAWIDIDGIDPALFHWQGRHYMVLNRGCRIIELNEDCTKAVSRPTLLWYGDGARTPEGPHLLEHDGWFYIFLAEGGTGSGHRVAVARSRTIEGPYEGCPYNPILQQTDGEGRLQYTGHGEPIEGPDGSWYLCFLGVRNDGSPWRFMGRETCLLPMEWTAEGWPLINKGRRPEVLVAVPEVPEVQEPEVSAAPYPAWKGREWVTPRPQDPAAVRVEQGNLVLDGSGCDLDALGCRSVLVERQQEDAGSVLASVTVPASLAEGDDVGITAYYDEHSFLKFGYGLRGGRPAIILEEYVGTSWKSRACFPVAASGRIQLRMWFEGAKRTFAWNDGVWRSAGTLEDTGYLSSEGLKLGKRFTGTMLGVYVHGTASVEFPDWRVLWQSKDRD